MQVTHMLYDTQLDDIKRLIAEASSDGDGVMPVIRDDTWPAWIGAAKAHLQQLVASAERKP